MTTKQTAAAQASATTSPTVLTFGRLPANIDLFENTFTAFAQAAALVRAGYVFSPGTAPMIFPNGTATISLTLGTPDQAAFDDAMKSVQAGRDAEEAAFEARVQAAAKHIVDSAAKAARDAELKAKITEQKIALAALEAAAGVA
ncbi:hypothetical protein ACFOHT_19415 [Massilia oculi]|uniref:Uncharacterized protein n=1 Tax=Massilia oculi TaxID=945844 RepID=A0A2S2DKQ1_9BURK|nr:hypothetical protein [Massilia oculi]AWL05898.1 hypothetical protein DIR46_16665 [Massilia oculi]